METKHNKLQYIKQYDKEHTQQLNLKLNKVHDADIIKQLDNVPNKQGYIKQLIRDDVNGSRKEDEH